MELEYSAPRKEVLTLQSLVTKIRADQLLHFACRKWTCEGGRGEAWRGEGKQEGVGSNKINMNRGSQSWRNH